MEEKAADTVSDKVFEKVPEPPKSVKKPEREVDPERKGKSIPLFVCVVMVTFST